MLLFKSIELKNKWDKSLLNLYPLVKGILFFLLYMDTY